MIIYSDIISNDELFSDASKITKREDVGVYQIDCKLVTRKGGDFVLEGANPSAEEADEGTDEAVESGLDVVLNHRLQETTFNKKTFQIYLKDFAKRLVSKHEEEGKSAEEIAEIKNRVMAGAKFLLASFSDLQFFTGENMDPEGSMVFALYENNAPVMYSFIDSVRAEKC